MTELSKKCTSCGVIKSLDFFSKQTGRKDGRKSNCKACVSASAKRYHSENREKLIEKGRLYYENNKEKCNAASADWAKRNIEKSRARFLRYRHKNLEKVNQYNKLRRLSNLARDAAKTAKRRSRKREATPHWLTDEHMKQILCFYEQAAHLSKTTGVKHHVDHIIPLRGQESLWLTCSMEFTSGDSERKPNEK